MSVVETIVEAKAEQDGVDYRPAPDARTMPRLKPPVRNKSAWDVLTHWKSRKVMGVWAPPVLLLFAVSVWLGTSAWAMLGGALFGIVAYSLVEYLMHRHLYHWEPQSRFWRIVTADMGRRHMRHHREPDEMHGAINHHQLPVAVIVLIAVIGAWVTMPSPLGFWLMAIAAGVTNYVLQELVHFGTHFLPMRHPLLAAMKRHHMIHHYRDWDMNYGLFWPHWDVVFGTHHTSRRKREKRAGQS